MFSIPTARADFSPTQTHRCSTPFSCDKSEKKVYLGPSKDEAIPVKIVIESIQKTYTPAGFDKSASLNSTIIFSNINAIRAGRGLAAFETSAILQEVALSRLSELEGEIASGRFHSGLYARKLPYWITENMKYGSNEAGTVTWWMNSYVHRSAILGNHKYSAGACLGNACIQLFSSFVPK